MSSACTSRRAVGACTSLTDGQQSITCTHQDEYAYEISHIHTDREVDVFGFMLRVAIHARRHCAVADREHALLHLT
jgi:hypothetical protein